MSHTNKSTAQNEGETVDAIEGGPRQLFANATFAALTRVFLNLPISDDATVISFHVVVERRLAQPAHDDIPARPERMLAKASASVDTSIQQIVAPVSHTKSS